jgi:hypothetical protein
MFDERMKILEMVEAGAINAADAAHLIQALEEDAGWPELPEGEGGLLAGTAIEDRGTLRSIDGDQVLPPNAARLARWKHWWLFPAGAGTALTVISGALLYAGSQAAWAGLIMVLLTLPLFAGIGIAAFGLASRRARWLHVRVNTGQHNWPRRVAISLPLPIRTVARILRIARGKIPGLEDIAIDEVLIALGESATPDAPLYVQVDQGTAGEFVEVYIG